MKQATIPLAAHIAMLDAVLAYVSPYQRDNARAAATAVGIGYEPKPPHQKHTNERGDHDRDG
jgi:hypothetical protein